MSVQSEIDRIITAVGNAYSKVSEKGGTVPSSKTVANLATAIDSIPAGGGAPSLQSKSVTYTANGTNTITTDEGYDGLSSVDVTVNVSGGGVETCTVEFRSNFPDEAVNYAYEMVILSVFENGKTTIKTFTKIKNLITIPNVICNSLAFIKLTATPKNVSSSNTNTISDRIVYPSNRLLEFVGDAVYTVRMSSGGGGIGG